MNDKPVEYIHINKRKKGKGQGGKEGGTMGGRQGGKKCLENGAGLQGMALHPFWRQIRKHG